ncbi:MAG: hypothetical protein ACP5OR_09270, partial [Candidatus Dormibacteria bacterium]
PIEESLTAVLYDLLTCDPWHTDITPVTNASGHFIHRITSPEGSVVSTDLVIQRSEGSVRIRYSSSHKQGNFSGTIRLVSQPDGNGPTLLQIRATVIPSGKIIRGARPSQASYYALIRGVADRIKACATLMTSTPCSNLRPDVLREATRVVRLISTTTPLQKERTIE